MEWPLFYDKNNKHVFCFKYVYKAHRLDLYCIFKCAFLAFLDSLSFTKLRHQFMKEKAYVALLFACC